jgi:hypothetical protein
VTVSAHPKTLSTRPGIGAGEVASVLGVEAQAIADDERWTGRAPLVLA